jgi:hypothetical protein
MKNIQPITDLTAYEAFGFAVQNGADQVTYFDRYAPGGTHTTKGGLYFRTFTGILEAVVSPPQVIYHTPENVSGVSGGQMDDGTTIVFFVVNHADATRDIYMVKGDSGNNFTAPVLFDWAGVTKLPGGFFYGPMVKGDNPGEYYHALYQVAPGRYRVSFVKTTDYWATYGEIGVLYDGTIPLSESAVANLGGGKFVSITRVNNGGGLSTIESSNGGVTWVRRPSSNLYWWNGGGPSIPWIYAHDGVFDIFYECRDTSMMHISKGNTVADNFGKSTPVYNAPEIYAYHKGTGTNPSLGYGCQLKLSNGKYFMIFSKEYTSARANLQWTMDDLVTDPGDVPASPEVAISAITATSFRFDITNYGDFQNVRYLTMDLSTSADFSSFVTCKYRAISAYPAAVINGIRMVGYWDTFNGLLTATTYYLRLSGVNNLGPSVPKIVTVTTH